MAAPNSHGDDAIYKPAYYDALVRADKKSDGWKLDWVLIFRKNPKPSQMPKGVTLPKNVDTHMFGPDVLLAGWPEDPKPAPKPARKAHHASKK